MPDLHGASWRVDKLVATVQLLKLNLKHKLKLKNFSLNIETMISQNFLCTFAYPEIQEWNESGIADILFPLRLTIWL